MNTKPFHRSYLVFIIAWVLIFVLCSVLSGVSSTAGAKNVIDNDHSKTPEQTTTQTSTSVVPHITTPPVSPDPPPVVNPTVFPELPFDQDNAQYVIFLDAGHGWADVGATVPDRTDISEKDLTLAITKRIQASLESMGYTVRMIRENDEDCLEELVDGIYRSARRITYANEHGGDYYVSIHADSFTDPTAHGPRIYYADSRTKAAVSEPLANAIAASLAEQLHIDTLRPRDDATYNVIMMNKMPSVLIEVGFVTNPTELANMLDEDWQELFARSVALGIDADVHADSEE